MIVQLLLNFSKPVFDFTIPVDLMRRMKERSKDQDCDDGYHYGLDYLVAPAAPQAVDVSVTG